jgi:hypothetical protein
MARLLTASSLVLSLVLALAVAGCAGRGGTAQTYPSADPAQLAAVAAGSGLPEPADLLEKAAPRNASYIEADLVKVGAAFDNSLANNLVSPDGDIGTFQPDHSPGAGLEGAAYCIYLFAIDGYDRNAQVRYDWTTAPANGTLFIALAAWDQNLWRWFAADPGEPVDVNTMLPYLGPLGELALVVLCTGTGNSELASVRIGGQPPQIVLGPTKDLTGFVPLSATVDASGSSDPDGEIVSFEWDTDGNGSFELNSGLTSSHQFEITEPGGFNAQLRVTDDDGLQATRLFAVRGLEEWTHSWGGSGGEIGIGVHYDGLNSIYVNGYTDSFGAGENDVVLLNYDLGGNLIWQRVWGSAADEKVFASSMDSDGSLVTLTQRDVERAVVVKFSPDGDVLWANEYGFLADDFNPAGLDTFGTNIYFTGYQSGGAGLPSAVVAKLDGNGEPAWIKRWNGGAVIGGGIQSYPSGISSRGVAVSGRIDDDVWLLLLNDEDGSLLSSESWGSPDNEIALGMMISGPFNPEFWLTGIHFGGSRKPFLLEHGSNPICKTWIGGLGPDHDELPRDIVQLSGGDLLINGWTGSFDAGTDAMYLRFSSAGIIQSSVRLTRASSDLAIWSDLELCTTEAVLSAGSCNAANNTSWTSADGTVGDLDYEWQDYIGSVESISVLTDAQSGELITPAGAILDTGAGEQDVLVTLRAVP